MRACRSADEEIWVGPDMANGCMWRRDDGQLMYKCPGSKRASGRQGGRAGAVVGAGHGTSLELK